MLSFLHGKPSRQRLATRFRWFDRKLFRESKTSAYTALHERRCYTLTLARDSYFAWETLEDERGFGDFVLEADLELDPSNGHSAVGVILRHVNEENFYSLLLSTRGLWRFDLLFNNHPVRLIEWTPFAAADRSAPRVFSVTVIAHGSHFSFSVNERWVGEIEDEVIASGGIGFAAQNYAGSGRGVFRLRGLLLETRPLSVEREHLRWTYFLPVPPASRTAFAHTLFTQGSFAAAAVQLRKAGKNRDQTVSELFLLAECYVRLSLYDKALAAVEEVMRREPEHREARLEKANLLYLTNRLLDARTHIESSLTDGSLDPSPALWNLLGNVEYGLGNAEASAAAYLKAVELQPDMPLFLRNAGRALERSGRKPEAVDLYLRASRLLFGEGAYGELALVVPRVLALDPSNPEARGIQAKTLYHDGRLDEALALLQGLKRDGAADASVHYLVGIILNGKGRREEALPHLERAAELEPAFPLYLFRLAETLHLMGRDPAAVLEKAHTLAPRDPWINNLGGLLRMKSRDYSGALDFFRRALEEAPAETDIRLNLSEALSLLGRHAEALESLGGSIAKGENAATLKNAAVLANQKGNILARQGEHARAAAEYETAIRADPGNPVYKENCAAACLEGDMVHRAEELLARLEAAHPSASVYNLLGSVALRKGERARAELAYAAGLGMEPGNLDLSVNLAMLHYESGRHEKAKPLLESALRVSPDNARAKRMLQKIMEERERTLSCSSCGRLWRVPRELPPQSGFTVRGEPPHEAPAGRCPQCGKLLCIGCATAHLRDGRFHCPECGEFLKLSDDSLKWLLARYIAREHGGSDSPAGAASSP